MVEAELPGELEGLDELDDDGLPDAVSRAEGDGMDGVEARSELDDGMDGMLLDDEDDDDGIEGMLLEEEDDDDEGIDGIELELWEDCWLADSHPARTRAAALITNRFLTGDLFILICPVSCLLLAEIHRMQHADACPNL